MADLKYKTFWEFYPFYLTQHALPANRAMHFIGTAIVICLFAYAIITMQWLYILLLPVAGYGFAWFGHFFLEKNKPATFTYPLFSLGSDFVMFWHILTGQISKHLDSAHKAMESKKRATSAN